MIEFYDFDINYFMSDLIRVVLRKKCALFLPIGVTGPLKQALKSGFFIFKTQNVLF